MASVNTKINYLYRDSNNYKVPNTCIIAGEISHDQILQIMECLDMGEFFIPRQVGLPEHRFASWDPDADHCWFELEKSGFEYTDSVPELNMNVQQLVEQFQAAKGNWDDSWMEKEGLL